MKLVIVESPTKAKTLTRLLGSEYTIKASNGHVRDLPKKELGVDLEDDFLPKYVIPPKNRKRITELKNAVKKCKTVVLATDPDREGEAIAWHVSQVIKKDSKMPKNLKFERVVFHEITKSALKEAFEKPEKLNDDLVDAQQARRVLDRLVGYNLSPLLWKKVRYGLSAGRVQSVAVRLIVERERERDAFKPEEYWSVEGEFETKNKDKFNAKLEKQNGKKIDLTTKKRTDSIVKDLDNDKFKVDKVTKSSKKRSAPTPFKTSTLQQNASNLFGFSASRTMRAAQKLFERGYITYHRTDSFSLAPSFVKSVRSFVKSQLGSQYLPEKAKVYKTKSKSAQEAHEAIRPTNIKTQLSQMEEKGFSSDEIKLYSLILKRSVECQTKDAMFDRTSIHILSDKKYEFKANGSVIKFDGWLAVGKMLGLEVDKKEMNPLPDIRENTVVTLNNLDSQQHFTQPPARFTDASLIKTLEELGIGRPSTYAPTIRTIQLRKYITKDGRYFVPEDVAYVVTDLLVDNFKSVMGYKFTAEMEKSLDEIAEGKLKWNPVIKDFYEPFSKKLNDAEERLSKKDVTKLGESEEECPDCGKILYIKLGKYGKFLSCSDFPECEFAKPIDGEGVDENGEAKSYGECDKCEEGSMVLKQGRFGKFLACNKYPKCKNTKQYLDKIGMLCPKCEEENRENGEVIVKTAKGNKTFYGCSNYPKCDYASWKDPREDKTE